MDSVIRRKSALASQTFHARNNHADPDQNKANHGGNYLQSPIADFSSLIALIDVEAKCRRRY